MALDSDEQYVIALSYGTIVGTGLLALLVCGARLATRKFLLKAWSADDWATLVALTITTAFNVIGVFVVVNGAGRHIQHVSPDHLKVWFLLYYCAVCMYLSISFAVKGSLILFLRRLFPVPYIQYTTVGLIVFMILFSVSGSFVAAFNCNPPKYMYDIDFIMQPDRAEHCFAPMTSYGIFMYQAVLLFCLDIILLLLPLPALWSLTMSRGKGLVLFLVFGSAIVACIAPALRFHSLDFYKTGSTDTTYVAASSLYWMCIEYNLGMVAGSLACLKPLFVQLGLVGPATGGPKDGLTPSYDKHSGGTVGTIGSGGTPRWALLRRGASRVQGDSILGTEMGTRVGHQKDADAGSKEHIVRRESSRRVTAGTEDAKEDE